MSRILSADQDQVKSWFSSGSLINYLVRQSLVILKMSLGIVPGYDIYLMHTGVSDSPITSAFVAAVLL